MALFVVKTVVDHVPEAASYTVAFVNPTLLHAKQKFGEYGPSAKAEALDVALGLAKLFCEVFINETRIINKT